MATYLIGGLVVGTIFMMIFSTFASNGILADATTSSDGVSTAGQCDLYPQSPAEAYAPLFNQSDNLVTRDRIWISVGEVDLREASWWVAHGNDDPDAIAGPVIHCTLLTAVNLDRIPRVAAAIEGANGCKAGIEVCELPSGISFGGELQYKLSISKGEARSIVEELVMVENKAILQHDGKYYLLQLFTTNEKVEPQARVEFTDPHFIGNTTHPIDDEIIRLEKSQSITVPFVVRTFATFGKPANISLLAGVHARDSGLTVSIEPSTFVIPERSTAKGNLTITAGTNAQDGVYQFSMTGRDGWIRTCGSDTYYSCPSIQIGDSIWQINTSDGGVGLGGRQPPEWLRLTTETDKDAYMMGEMVTIRSFIENGGNETITLEGIRLVIDIGNKTVLANPNSSTTALNNHYTIDAYSYNGNDAITVQPHSKVLLVRPFFWNQGLGEPLMSGGPASLYASVQAGNYTIRTSLAGYEGTAIYDNKNIQIAAASYGDDVVANSPPFLRKETASRNFLVELTWAEVDSAQEERTETNKNVSTISFGVSFFDSNGFPEDRLVYDFMIGDPSTTEMMYQNLGNQYSGIGPSSHDVTFDGAVDGPVQVNIVIRSAGQQPVLLNDKVTFDIAVVPEYPAAMIWTIFMLFLLGTIIITTRAKLFSKGW